MSGSQPLERPKKHSRISSKHEEGKLIMYQLMIASFCLFVFCQPKQTNLFGETLPTWHVYEFPKDKYQQFVEVYFSREIKKGNLISRENLLRDAQVNIYSRCSS